MGWFGRSVDGWASKQQAKELQNFINLLKPLDGSEIGLTVALATHQRHAMNANRGWDLLQPSLVLLQDEMAAFHVVKAIEEFQRRGDAVTASGLMVWAHTLRATLRLELRQLGRDMWRQLERGFPHVEDASESFYRLTQIYLDTDGANCFPDGLTPDPL